MDYYSTGYRFYNYTFGEVVVETLLFIISKVLLQFYHVGGQSYIVFPFLITTMQVFHLSFRVIYLFRFTIVYTMVYTLP